MRFAIRDDDTSFFTHPDDLDKAYDFLRGGCVSLSVVPYTVPVHKDDVFPYGKGINYAYYDIASNHELIHALREGISIGKYDILLHGFSHEYKQVNGSWCPEMIWKSYKQLEIELTKGKKHLETLFDKKMSVFVAPNNAINQTAISIIEKLGMNYSGIIQTCDRKMDAKYFWNFINRWGYRFFCGIPYPGILDYGKHKELVAYTLDSYDRLVCEYNVCKKRNQPFVVYTHYWHVNNDIKTKNLLRKITEYVLDDGAELVALSGCFEASNND